MTGARCLVVAAAALVLAGCASVDPWLTVEDVGRVAYTLPDGWKPMPGPTEPGPPRSFGADDGSRSIEIQSIGTFEGIATHGEPEEILHDLVQFRCSKFRGAPPETVPIASDALIGFTCLVSPDGSPADGPRTLNTIVGMAARPDAFAIGFEYRFLGHADRDIAEAIAFLETFEIEREAG